MNKEQLKNITDEISLVQDVLKLQTDFINFVPKADDNNGLTVIRYNYLHNALNNLHSVNQGLARKLEQATSQLYELMDQLDDLDLEGIEGIDLQALQGMKTEN